MKGDRVTVGVGPVFSDGKGGNVACTYQPRVDNQGRPLLNGDGTAVVDLAGGVAAGSRGVIHGAPLKVNKSTLKEYTSANPGLAVNEVVLLYPIMLDAYQKVGWFVSDNIRILAGTS